MDSKPLTQTTRPVLSTAAGLLRGRGPRVDGDVRCSGTSPACPDRRWMSPEEGDGVRPGCRASAVGEPAGRAVVSLRDDAGELDLLIDDACAPGFRLRADSYVSGAPPLPSVIVPELMRVLFPVRKTPWPPAPPLPLTFPPPAELSPLPPLPPVMVLVLE